MQTTVDARYAITLDYKVTNTNDFKALKHNVQACQNDFTALYDKGYHTGSELKYAVESGINAMAAVPGVAAFAPDQRYNFDKFIYDEIKTTISVLREINYIPTATGTRKAKREPAIL